MAELKAEKIAPIGRGSDVAGSRASPADTPLNTEALTREKPAEMQRPGADLSLRVIEERHGGRGWSIATGAPAGAITFHPDLKGSDKIFSALRTAAGKFGAAQANERLLIAPGECTNSFVIEKVTYFPSGSAAVVSANFTSKPNGALDERSRSVLLLESDGKPVLATASPQTPKEISQLYTKHKDEIRGLRPGTTFSISGKDFYLGHDSGVYYRIDGDSMERWSRIDNPSIYQRLLGDVNPMLCVVQRYCSTPRERRAPLEVLKEAWGAACDNMEKLEDKKRRTAHWEVEFIDPEFNRSPDYALTSRDREYQAEMANRAIGDAFQYVGFKFSAPLPGNRDEVRSVLRAITDPFNLRDRKK